MLESEQNLIKDIDININFNEYSDIANWSIPCNSYFRILISYYYDGPSWMY